MVTDNCNGVVNLVLPRIFRALDIEFLSINSKIDPKFPNRMPEPTRENLSPLSRIVVKERASFGVGFDGDGDRSVFIDDKGRISFGTSPHFELPESIVKHLLNGVELGNVMDKITGEYNTKQKRGAIGFFTKNIIDRKNLYVQSLVVALVPFINENLYFEK